MTMKPKARKFRLKTPDQKPQTENPAAQQPAAEEQTPPVDGNIDSPAQVAAETDIDAIRKEGLTGRQLRMARRMAHKHNISAVSDFDAVRQLRARGIDPFERSSILEIVTQENGGGGPQVPAAGPAMTGPARKNQLPQTVPQQSRALTDPDKGDPAERRASEILRIQQDIARRRRRKLFALFSRLGVFVILPTIMTAYYYFVIATPMYETKSAFVIQQANPSGGGSGFGSLLQGTSMATQADAIAVQEYLLSLGAMARLDANEGFKVHYSQDWIDPIQRLEPDASDADAYKMYQRLVTIGYDPTEGTLKMQVVAADPETSQRFSEALISYAEERVDQLTQRMREDQMSGALAYYQEAEDRRDAALQELLRIQTELETISPDSEINLIMGQISNLETRRQDKILELASLQSVARPSEARVNAVEGEIASLLSSIAELRQQLTEATGDGSSLATKTTELRAAEENYQFQIVLVEQALASMDAARNEANRQVRYLSTSVEPIAPDDATYPKAFENTLVALLIFAGIYLMISLTASVLREQVSS